MECYLMDSPPVPKPRTGLLPQNDGTKKPVPLPRTKVPTGDKVTASDILRSISTVSKQISEDVAQKVSNSAKSANEKIEKSIMESSKFAKGTLEKTLTTSRAVRDSVTKSVIEGTKTAGLRLRRNKKSDSVDEEDFQRCVSMPVVDVSLFDNIQFHSPLLEQKKRLQNGEAQCNQDLPSLQLNASHLDDLSVFSSNSDSNTDSVSNFSHDSREFEQSPSLNLEQDMTYDAPKSSRANSICSTLSTPEVPERRKKRESKTEFMKQNSVYENFVGPIMDDTILRRNQTNSLVTFDNKSSYENWSLPGGVSVSSSPENPRPSQSTIIEFDPLKKSPSMPKYEGMSNELLLLESFLIGDTYGTIVPCDNNEDSISEYNESEYFNPPTPPERSDSLFPTETKTTQELVEKESSSNWYNNDEDTKSVVEEKSMNTVLQRFSRRLKLDKTSKPVKQSNQKPDVVERPPMNQLPVPYYCGMLTRIVSGVVEDLFKNSQSRYCVLSEQKMMCYLDPTNSILKEVYTLDSIYSLQIVLPLSSSTTSNSYCFEVSVAAGGIRSAPRKVLFSCTSAPERRNWAQKIAEHLTSVFPTKHTAEFTRCGWCYLKEGVSGIWGGAWMMLIRRLLVYSVNGEPVRAVDLRKTRCVVTQEADEEERRACPSDCPSRLVLDCPDGTLYLRFPHERELKGWRYMVKLSAHNNGAYLHHQQLTKHDVPALVDKCISFIYAHGTLSEGIYRRAGRGSALSSLLARFRRDAWSVQLCPAQHSEHDVAGVLKRFFRDLPEPLFSSERRDELLAAMVIDEEAARHSAYSHVVTSLPLVACNTARKLFAHLHFVHTMAHANKMNAENLASVWAPTIMPANVTSDKLATAWSTREVLLVRELIANYEQVWAPTPAERRLAAGVRGVLARALTSPAAPCRAAGDLKAWLYVHDRNNCCQIALTPNKTCGDVCVELSGKADMDSHLLTIEEVVCGESLRRIVHVDEVLLDVVLRWGYWDEEDRRDNYLLVRGNKSLHDIEALRNTAWLVCGELRLANETSKTFKQHMFEFQNGKLSCFKDKQGSHKLEEWDVKDILWYTGHEPKRNPQSRWAITFIPRNNKLKRSKERPWFGTTIAGAVTEDQFKWTAAMMLSEHATILPTPRLVIT